MLKLRLVFGILIFMGLGTSMGGQDFFELPPIRYSETHSNDEVPKMAREIEAGSWEGFPADGKGFLKAVLTRLQVPEESQVLVFLKNESTELSNSSSKSASDLLFDGCLRRMGAGREGRGDHSRREVGAGFLYVGPSGGRSPATGGSSHGLLFTVPCHFANFRGAGE